MIRLNGKQKVTNMNYVNISERLQEADRCGVYTRGWAGGRSMVGRDVAGYVSIVRGAVKQREAEAC